MHAAPIGPRSLRALGETHLLSPSVQSLAQCLDLCSQRAAKAAECHERVLCHRQRLARLVHVTEARATGSQRNLGARSLRAQGSKPECRLPRGARDGQCLLAALRGLGPPGLPEQHRRERVDRIGELRFVWMVMAVDGDTALGVLQRLLHGQVGEVNRSEVMQSRAKAAAAVAGGVEQWRDFARRVPFAPIERARMRNQRLGDA